MPTAKTQRKHPITGKALRAHARYWTGQTRDMLMQAADKIEHLEAKRNESEALLAKIHALALRFEDPGESPQQLACEIAALSEVTL